MKVRTVEASDRSAIQRMAARFLSQEGPYGTRFAAAPDRIKALVALVTEQPHATAFIADHDGVPVGMFGVFYIEHPITGERIASELCWWMEPEARGSRAAMRLLRAAETWGRGNGAVWMEMIAPSERVAEFYHRLGYERTDVHYLKRL